jgi:F-type H+-transporting ATPase subunit c
MKSFLRSAMVLLGGVLVSSVAFAQDGGASVKAWIPVGAALAIGLAAFGAASAQGRAASAALEGIARNPTAKDAMFLPFILGLVFMEFQALLGFVIAIIWTTGNWAG